MCVRSVGLDDAPYVKVPRHVRLLAISTHNDEGNWVNPKRVLILWIDISHGLPNLTSARVYHSICQRCTCHGSSSPRAKLPLSTRWQYTILPWDRMPFWRKVSSARVPGCQRCTVVTRAPRGLTFSVNVISFGTDSPGRESSAANLFGIRLSDRPSDRRVGTGAAMNPGNFPGRQDAPSADWLYLWDSQHLKSIECLP